jgi:hypothetical protein
LIESARKIGSAETTFEDALPGLIAVTDRNGVTRLVAEYIGFTLIKLAEADPDTAETGARLHLEISRQLKGEEAAVIRAEGSAVFGRVILMRAKVRESGAALPQYKDGADRSIFEKALPLFEDALKFFEAQGEDNYRDREN